MQFVVHFHHIYTKSRAHTQHMNRKYGTDVPLVLMNSFNTHADTERIRFKYERRVNLYMFQQSYYPRVLLETLRPFPEKFNLQDGWCVCVCVCLSVCVYLCLYMCLSVCVFLNVCLSVGLNVCVRLSVCLSVCMCVSTSV